MTQPCTANAILAVLDACDAFPMLDNGYLYLAATRLSLHRSATDWAMVFEVFGYSPRAGDPDVAVITIASKLHQRNQRDHYVSQIAYETYLRHHAHDEFRAFFPVDQGDWMDQEQQEIVASDATTFSLRGQPMSLPPLDDYAQHGVALQLPPRVQVFEFCRWLAGAAREQVLATPAERRVSVLPEMRQLLVLDEWHHPDVVKDERPSHTATFRQLAEVLATGETSRYQPSALANTHWRHWPEGGTL